MGNRDGILESGLLHNYVSLLPRAGLDPSGCHAAMPRQLSRGVEHFTTGKVTSESLIYLV